MSHRGRPGARRHTRARRTTLAAVVFVALAAAGCADTVSPVIGGLKIGVQNGALRPPERVDPRVAFDYPADAWERHVGGTTVLKLLISAEGTVDSAYVLESSGDRSLDSAAVANARRLRYRPAEQGGEPVPIWGRLPVIYPLPEEIDEYEPEP